MLRRWMAVPMALALIATGLVVSGLTGCGADSVPGVAPEHVELIGWEQEYSADEMTTWRYGTINELPFISGPEFDPDLLQRSAGAKVELLAPRPDGVLGDNGRPPFRVVATTTTAEDGSFRVGPGPLERWALRVTKPGYAPAYCGNGVRLMGIFGVDLDGPITFGLRPAHEVHGRIVDGDGAPVPGASAEVESLGYFEHVTTDENGVFKATVPAGPFSVHASDPTRRGGWVGSSAPLPSMEQLVVEAPDLGPIEGIVVDANGDPIPAAVVLNLQEPWHRTTTDEDGRYSLEAPRRGDIAAFGNGYGWRTLPAPRSGELEMRLRDALRVTGRVLGPDGNPVADARLYAVRPRHDATLERVTGPVTAADGSFSFDWVTPPPIGSKFPVVILAHRRGMGDSPAIDVSTINGPVELQLPGLRVLKGRVRREGVHVEGAEPAIIDVSWNPMGMSRHAGAALGRRMFRMVQVAPDGTWEVPGVPNGVEIEVETWVDGATYEQTLDESETSTPEIVLEPGKPIAGRIVDTEDNPLALPGTTMVLAFDRERYGRFRRDGVINADGTFRFENLPVGTYSVRGDVDGYDVMGQVVEAGRVDLRLVAERPAPLPIRVVFPEGVEPVPMTVRMWNAEDAAYGARTRTWEPVDGEVGGIFELVRKGRYHVVASGGVWRGVLRDLAVPDGTREPYEIELRRTQRRAATLEDQNGNPLMGYRVIFVKKGAEYFEVETHWSGEGGSLDVTGLEEGEWEARLSTPGRAQIVEPFTVGPNDSSEPIELRVPPHGAVLLELTDPLLVDDGGLYVDLRDGDGRPLYAWTPDAIRMASRFAIKRGVDHLEIPGVPAGTVRVRLMRGSEELASQQIELEANQRATVRVP